MPRNAVLLILVFLQLSNGQFPDDACPQHKKRYKGFMPNGNASAGVYKIDGKATTVDECVESCCLERECNVAWMANSTCFHITCHSNNLCLPKLNSMENNRKFLTMVLVRAVSEEETWSDVLKRLELVEDDSSYSSFPDQFERGYKDILQFEGNLDYATTCIVGVQPCAENEECIQFGPNSPAGACRCKPNYSRNENRICVFTAGSTAAEEPSKKKILVVAESKEIRLPADQVILKAEVSPPPLEEEKYNYQWTSLNKPDGSTAVKEQKGEVLQLTKLSEGLYTFKVNVTGENAYGEAFVNVSVLPAAHENQPPQIIITPANQTIKLPNTKAVLDASNSKDDDGIVKYHWEVQNGPVGYQPHLSDSATLVLNDLTIPGHYIFKLTVTDTNKETSTATANVTVLQITDYPPEANAGPDVVIFLPQNKITLNGSLSTDDHNITVWEWTKTDTKNAVDMQDTRTPLLKLSNLEQGMYTFQLKVTDSLNQSSVASVHVFVKPPTNEPPVARTAENVTISLPQTWAVLNANLSTDDNEIVAYKWIKQQGPSNVQFANASLSSTNVTGLTKGSYVFNVTVTDNNGNNASALQYVIVTQNKNQRPVANAGEDMSVDMPVTAIYINGSKSSDDWAIVQWKWTRADGSLAFGKIAEKSDEQPVLILTDVVPGIYIFNLTVRDEQGESSSDNVTLTINSDPKLDHLVDIIVNYYIKKFTHAQYENLKGKLTLLAQDQTKLEVRELYSQMGTNKVVIRFYMENGDGQAMDANEVVHHFRQKLSVDAGILGFSVDRLQTALCQNNCSFHGTCDERTRECICDTFWMHDLFKAYFYPEEDSDCSWSILYVVLGVLCSLLAIVGSVWGGIYLCMNRCSCKPPPPTTSYKLIENADDHLPRKVTDLSDSDSDSDVIFEARNKPRFGGGDLRNGHKVTTRNGFVKMGRRIKT